MPEIRHDYNPEYPIHHPDAIQDNDKANVIGWTIKTHIDQVISLQSDIAFLNGELLQIPQYSESETIRARLAEAISTKEWQKDGIEVDAQLLSNEVAAQYDQEEADFKEHRAEVNRAIKKLVQDHANEDGSEKVWAYTGHEQVFPISRVGFHHYVETEKWWNKDTRRYEEEPHSLYWIDVSSPLSGRFDLISLCAVSNGEIDVRVDDIAEAFELGSRPYLDRQAELAVAENVVLALQNIVWNSHDLTPMQVEAQATNRVE